MNSQTPDNILDAECNKFENLLGDLKLFNFQLNKNIMVDTDRVKDLCKEILTSL